MTIAVLGSPSATQRRKMRLAKFPTASPKRALLRVAVGARPPRKSPAAPWLWCATRAPSCDDAARAIAAGAYDVVTIADLPRALPERLAELAIDPARPEAPVDYVARSPAARRVLVEIERVARTNLAVLLTGEPGTGKDLIAHHIHRRSGRTGRLVPINCAALPDDVIERELFGVRGAAGLIKAASDGTLFLDEIDDTPKTFQIKLLRVLEDHVVSRLGENRPRRVDFRVIAASSRDLERLDDELYHRLAIATIELPALRDRGEDLPELVHSMIARFHRDEPRSEPHVTRVAPTAMAALARYPWPGNVRELRNVIFQALVTKRSGTELLLSDLPEHVVHARVETVEEPAPIDRSAIARRLDAGQLDLRALRDELEKTALVLALERAQNSPTRAARLLGNVGRGSSSDPGGTVRAMMKRHGLV